MIHDVEAAVYDYEEEFESGEDYSLVAPSQYLEQLRETQFRIIESLNMLHEAANSTSVKLVTHPTPASDDNLEKLM